MDFFRIKKFIRSQKPYPHNRNEGETEDPKGKKKVDKSDEAVDADTIHAQVEAEPDDDDDDDFITDEVKRRLKELRRNSFMALIPEEASPGHENDDDDDEEGGETSSSEWRDVEAEGRQFWSVFYVFYDRYHERMLFFDSLIAQQLNEIGSYVPSTPSPRSASKKLSASLRCLSLKKLKYPEDEMEQLQQPGSGPYQDLETAYIGQMCLTWEALHCQYTQLSQKISCGLENCTAYNHSAQQFQHFQVLLQRFIENEPFQQGSRPEVYVQTRKSLPKLLQVPKVQGTVPKILEEDDSDVLVLAPNLMMIIESSILTFYQFVKMDKKKSGGVRSMFVAQNQMATPLQQIQSSMEKSPKLQKALKLKDQFKKTRRWKKSEWPSMQEDVELLLGTIDIKVLSRVVSMGRMNKEQLFWCEEKMKKIDTSGDKLQRDPSPLLFPC